MGEFFISSPPLPVIFKGKTQMPRPEEKDGRRVHESLEVPRDNSTNKETTIIKSLNDSIENLKNSIILTNHTDVSFQKTIPDEEDDEALFVYMVESGDYSKASKIDYIVVRVEITNRIDPTVLNTSIQHMIEHLTDRPKTCHIWLKTLQANKLIEFIQDMLLKPDVQTISRSLFRLETRDVYTNLGAFVKDLMAIREHGLRVTGACVYGSYRDPKNPRKLMKAQGSISSFIKNEATLKKVQGDYLVNFRLTTPISSRLYVMISYFDKTVSKPRSAQTRHQYITVDQLVQAEHVVEFGDEGQMFEFEVDAGPENLNPVTMAYDPVLSFNEFYSVLSKKFPNSCDQ